MRCRSLVAFLFLFLGVYTVQTYGQVVATWNGGTGNWSNSANWNPATVPNNSGSTTYNVGISSSGSAVTMDVLDDTINNLTLGTTTSLNIGFGNRLSLVSGASSNSGSINNRGVLTNDGAFANSGILMNQVGRVNNNGTFANTGTVMDQMSNFNNFGTLTNAGTYTSADSTLSNSGTVTNASSMSFTHGGIVNSGNFVNSGTISASNFGSIENSGAFTNSGNVSLGVISVLNNSGSLINSGTITTSASLSTQVINSGAFLNSGTFLNAGQMSNTGTFTNSGAVTISTSGIFTTSTNYTQAAGSTAVNGTLTATNGAIVNIQGGILSGTGTINGNVLMAGTLMPGDAPGTLAVFGNYEQTSKGTLEELMSPLAHSFFDVHGNVVLDPGASLQISLLDGFNPLGQTFSIMDFSSLTGQFASLSFWDDGYLWDITYGQHEIDVTAVQAPEPGSLLLLAIGSLALAAFALRKK